MQLKNKIEVVVNNIEVNKQLLRLGDQRLEDDRTVNDYTIWEDDQIDLLCQF